MSSNTAENRKHNPSKGFNNLAIAWIDLRFCGQSLLGQKSKPILNDISGSIDFGSLNAMMGPSGAGKSTLLKCINGRQMDGVERSSDIYLNAHTNIRSCFIVQDVSEHLLYGLTAMQSLIYASKLKNCDEEEECNHKMNAKKLLSDLMISDTEDTPVERCSGGEQKRLVIALELTSVRKPNLLCIDEPTSGLDSNAAEIVIHCLREVSRKHNIGIATSIHQPNNDVLMLFDKLYVLAKGGHCVYEGPPQDLRNYLMSAEIECNENQVPIEVLLKTASKFDERVKRLIDLNSKSSYPLRHNCVVSGKLSPKGIQRKTLAFSFIRMWYLFQRAITYSFQSQWKGMVIQFFFMVGFGFVATKLYSKHIGEPDGCFSFELKQNDSCVKTVDTLKVESYISQNLRLQFFGAVGIQFLMTMSTTLSFAAEVKIFFNEHKNGWYSTGSYYWAKTVVELPLCLSITFCYAFCLYKGNNQIEEQFRELGYLATIIAGVLCSQGLGFTVGIIANPNDKLAIVLAVGLYLSNVMFCGFFAPIGELPEAIRWITNASFAKQTFEMILTLLYGFDRCPPGYIAAILYQLNITEEKKFWTNSVILGAQVINFRFLALFVLLIRANPIRLGFPQRVQNKNKKITVTVEPVQVITHM